MSPRLAVLADLVFDGSHFRREPLAIEVSRGRITGVRPYGGGEIVGREVIDARGWAVIPGLFNAHTHLARGGMFDPNEFISADQIARNLRDLLRAGVTAAGETGCAGGLVHALRARMIRPPTPRFRRPGWTPNASRAKQGPATPCGRRGAQVARGVLAGCGA